MLHSLQMFNLFCVRTPQGKWLLQLHHVCLQCNCRLCLVFKNKMCFLQTYTKENGFIITHYPSQDQVAEFIRNIVDYECRTVIFLDPLHNSNSVRAFLIVPSLVYDNGLLPLLSMTWCFPNCCLYFPTYWGIKYMLIYFTKQLFPCYKHVLYSYSKIKKEIVLSIQWTITNWNV